MTDAPSQNLLLQSAKALAENLNRLVEDCKLKPLPELQELLASAPLNSAGSHLLRMAEILAPALADPECASALLAVTKYYLCMLTFIPYFELELLPVQLTIFITRQNFLEQIQTLCNLLKTYPCVLTWSLLLLNVPLPRVRHLSGPSLYGM